MILFKLHLALRWECDSWVWDKFIPLRPERAINKQWRRCEGEPSRRVSGERFVCRALNCSGAIGEMSGSSENLDGRQDRLESLRWGFGSAAAAAVGVVVGIGSAEKAAD